MKVLRKDLIYFLFLVPIFKPYCLTLLYAGGMLDTLYDLFRIIFLGMFIILYIKKSLYNGFALIAASFLYEFCVLYSYTLMGNGMLRIGAFINCIYVILSINYLMNEEPMRTIKCLSFLISMLIFVNFILFIIFPHGLNYSQIEEGRVNFLGKDNNYIVWALIAFFSVYCYQYYFRQKLKIYYFILIVNTIVSLLYSSSTGKVIWLFVLIAVSLKKIKPLVSLLTFWRTIVFFVFVYIGVIIFDIQTKFSQIISIFFNKDSDLSDRTFIWLTIKRLINENPILGIGTSVVEIDGWYGAVSYSHNLILDILLKGGIIALTAFLVVLVCWNTYQRKLKVRNHDMYTICIVFLFAFLVEGMMEGLEDSVQFWYFLAISGKLSYKNYQLVSTTNECYRYRFGDKVRNE